MTVPGSTSGRTSFFESGDTVSPASSRRSWAANALGMPRDVGHRLAIRPEQEHQERDEHEQQDE